MRRSGNYSIVHGHMTQKDKGKGKKKATSSKVKAPLAGTTTRQRVVQIVLGLALGLVAVLLGVLLAQRIFAVEPLKDFRAEGLELVVRMDVNEYSLQQMDALRAMEPQLQIEATQLFGTEDVTELFEILASSVSRITFLQYRDAGFFLVEPRSAEDMEVIRPLLGAVYPTLLEDSYLVVGIDSQEMLSMYQGDGSGLLGSLHMRAWDAGSLLTFESLSSDPWLRALDVVDGEGGFRPVLLQTFAGAVDMLSGSLYVTEDGYFARGLWAYPKSTVALSGHMIDTTLMQKLPAQPEIAAALAMDERTVASYLQMLSDVVSDQGRVFVRQIFDRVLREYFLVHSLEQWLGSLGSLDVGIAFLEGDPYFVSKGLANEKLFDQFVTGTLFRTGMQQTEVLLPDRTKGAMISLNKDHVSVADRSGSGTLMKEVRVGEEPLFYAIEEEDILQVMPSMDGEVDLEFDTARWSTYFTSSYHGLLRFMVEGYMVSAGYRGFEDHLQWEVLITPTPDDTQETTDRSEG